MKTYITPEEAISVLPESDSIHTFRNNGFTLIGADWSRDDIVNEFNSGNVIELTGPAARGTNHGICTYPQDAKYQSDILFIETVESKVLALEKELEAHNDI